MFIRKTLALSLLLALSACRNDPPAATGTGTEPGAAVVVAAIYPLEFVANRVAGGLAEVKGLTAAGVEPHDLELTAGQIATLIDADLILYVGEDFQPALEAQLDQVEGTKLDALAGGNLIEGGDGHSDEEEEEAGHDEEPGFDPHVWLDAGRMVELARSVEKELASIAPDHAGDFKANAAKLVADLESLDQEFATGLAECERREIVTGHSAFGYLAARYELEQHGIAGIDPESEPSPKRLAEVTELVRQEGVTTIFFETLLPPALAETIARETGTTTAVLDPLESQPESGDYLTAMQANLSELRKALGCR